MIENIIQAFSKADQTKLHITEYVQPKACGISPCAFAQTALIVGDIFTIACTINLSTDTLKIYGSRDMVNIYINYLNGNLYKAVSNSVPPKNLTRYLQNVDTEFRISIDNKILAEHLQNAHTYNSKLYEYINRVTNNSNFKH